MLAFQRKLCNMGKNRDILNDIGLEDAIIFENPDYDDAIIGVTHDNKVVYSFEKMVQHLVRIDNMSEEDAIEFIEYNTIRAIPYFGPNEPVVLMNEDLFSGNE